MRLWAAVAAAGLGLASEVYQTAARPTRTRLRHVIGSCLPPETKVSNEVNDVAGVTLYPVPTRRFSWQCARCSDWWGVVGNANHVIHRICLLDPGFFGSCITFVSSVCPSERSPKRAGTECLVPLVRCAR